MALLDAITGKSARDAAAKNAAEFNKAKTEGLGDLDSGLGNATSQYDNAINSWSNLGALGTKYGRATDAYMDALGLNGAEGNARAQAAFTTSPSYQFQVDEALKAAQRTGARFAPGGNEMAEATRLATGYAGDQQKAYLDRLAGFVPQELTATQGTAAGQAAGYTSKGGAYMDDAKSRVGLRTTVASGIANSNTAAANAEMQASSAFWKNLTDLGTAAIGTTKGPLGGWQNLFSWSAGAQPSAKSGIPSPK